jgi:hypothetical protein
MTCTLTDVADALQTILGDEADRAARDSGFCQRASKLDGPAFAQAMTFGCLADPSPTLEDFAQAAADAGVPVRPQAIDQRLGPAAADCLRRVLQAAVGRLLVAGPADVPLLRRFAGVRLQDSTVVTLPAELAADWPGCGGRGDAPAAALKLQVRLDLLDGRLEGPVPGPGTASDTRGGLPPDDLPAGVLWVVDRGYFDLQRFAELSGRGVHWLTRPQPNTAVFVAGRRVELADWLAGRRGPTADTPIELGVEQRLPARLVAVRVPTAEAQRRRRTAEEKARKKGRRPSTERLALCDWDLRVTDVPAERATAAEVVALGRARWQIELLFKHWKSDGGLGRCRGEKPWRVICEVFASLLAAVVRHWAVLVGGGVEPSLSRRRAGRAVRRRATALALALALGDAEALVGVLESLRQVLTSTARIERRRRRPSTDQQLQTPIQQGFVLT